MRYRLIKMGHFWGWMMLRIRDGELMAAQVYTWERERDAFRAMVAFRSETKT